MLMIQKYSKFLTYFQIRDDREEWDKGVTVMNKCSICVHLTNTSIWLKGYKNVDILK